MSEKGVRVGTTAALATVIGACSLCAFGPALLAFVVTTTSAWSAGLASALAFGIGLVAAFLAYRCRSAWKRTDQKHHNKPRETIATPEAP
jgi:threonine/homoserine/homoserine lactone efflux protein